MPDRRPYLVIAGEDQSTLSKRIEEAYPGYYKVRNAPVFFIKTGHLTGEVKERLGIGDGTGKVDGAVLRLNGSYAGFFEMGLWDWLD